MKGHENPRSAGFTLVELMITMVLAGLITTTLYTAYESMQRSYIAQDQVAELQQVERAAMDILSRDIRLAGFDATGSAGAGICAASQGQIHYTTDLDESGTVPPCAGGGPAEANENVQIGFAPADDAGGDGFADAGVASLGRNANGAGYFDIADNIVAVEFNYILDDGNSTKNPTATQLDQIEKVQISLLARAGGQDTKYTDSRTYVTGSGSIWGPFNDNFRRRLLVTTIQCRNMGI